MAELNSIPVTTLAGREATFGEWSDDVRLVVNVASRCGLAPQYEQLEELQRRYGDRGFTVLAFPSNQFLQEYRDNEKIAEYCAATWGVTFPMMAKVRVNGRTAHPLYRELVRTPDAEGKAGRITWNFEKFLVLPDGIVHRFRPRVLPDDPAIVTLIEAALAREPRSLAAPLTHPGTQMSTSTLPTAPRSTASWAAAVSSSRNRVSGRPCSSPTRSAPSASAAETAATASAFCWSVTV